MKMCLIIFSFFFTQVLFAQTKIIEYQFGNQITGSTFVVNTDGSISHGERTCCPPRTDKVIHDTLAQSDLEKLSLLIEGAKVGSQSTFGAGSSGNGSSAGSLIVYDLKGEKINIRTIGFGDGAGGLQPVDFNTSSEAREIEKFVFDNVVQKMPF